MIDMIKLAEDICLTPYRIMAKEGKKCKSCKQRFISKDPDEEICSACKIDEAEYRYGDR